LPQPWRSYASWARAGQICCCKYPFHNEIIRYPLEVKNYEELRLENPFVPRILIIILVPDSQEDWLHQSQQELSLRYCGYWASLRGLPPTQNQNTVTVQIPTQNIFNKDALKSLMQSIESGELL
jgi:Domain of unknown function (DUF4365)